MKKEELIKLLETLELEEVKSLKIVYYTEKHYGMYDSREATTLTINEKEWINLKDEIKEILNKLEIVARKHTIEVCEDGSKIETMPASVVDELRLNNYSSKLLLDYITNLQQENEKLKLVIKNHSIIIPKNILQGVGKDE